MRRKILLTVALCFAMLGFSQNVTINFNDGTSVQYNLGNISSIVLSDGESEGDASIVGVWECTYFKVVPESYSENSMKVGDRIFFKSDGTYSTDNEIGKWSLTDNILTVMVYVEDIESYGMPFNYKVEKLTSKELEISADLIFVSFYIKLKRVS